jgi:hypothetical protein
MSTIFKGYADQPEQIKKEGEEITLRFSRIDDNTGKVTWNIPPSVKGCESPNGVYDGIVITVSRQPANYIGSSPKDGTYYIGDPTVDPNLHSGSEIENGVLVVGAFYNDRTTTELEVFDLEPRTAYYFSGYAVDNVARYHREGVHSYSLPTGVEESDDDEVLPARHRVMLEDRVQLASPTGLDHKKDYKLKLMVGCEDHELTIRGRKSQTYKDLLNEIEYKSFLLDDPYKSPDYPFSDTIFQIDDIFYKWDGTNRVTINPILSEGPPNEVEMGFIWFDMLNNELFEYESNGWESLSFIDIEFDITSPSSNTIWLDRRQSTDNAWIWRDNKWCKLNLISSDRNPLLPPKLDNNTYWYNTTSFEFFKWDKKIKRWKESLTIYYNKDPNGILPGDFWYDETEEVVKYLTLSNEWEEIPAIRYSERDEDGDLPFTIDDDDLPSYNPGYFWFIPSEQKLYKREPGEWVLQDLALYPTDPMDRESCMLWWNSDTDNLYSWDKVNEQWIEVENFFIQDLDPSKAEKLPENSVWYNPTSGQLLMILDSTCKEYDYIDLPFDPTNPPIGFVWKNESEFKIWNGDFWIDLDVLLSDTDPTNLENGTYWLRTTDSKLFKLDNDWIEVEVSDTDPKPKEGFLWLDTTQDKLYKWHIDKWIEAIGPFTAEFQKAKCPDDNKDSILFKSRKIGCDAILQIDRREKDSVFAHLNTRVRYGMPMEGQDLMHSTPMYKALGVGDDGSPDERRALHRVIRELLGEPTTKVELSKSQIDTCIDNALNILRKYSGQAYKRGFFFLDLYPNQQIYKLKDRCVEFNKIVNVTAVYRLRSAFLRGAYSGYDIFGYAALKQLYTLGTFDILSFHLVSSFIEELEHLFATRVTFQWVERTRELKLYNSVHAHERVLVDASLERTEQDLMVDRETSLWLQRWAVAEAKMMLSQSRGKYQSLPGPAGSTVLNAQELITQSEAEKAILMEELEDPAMSGILEVGQKGYFILG